MYYCNLLFSVVQREPAKFMTKYQMESVETLQMWVILRILVVILFHGNIISRRLKAKCNSLKH